MTIKTPEQIAREAALAVLNEYDAELVHDGECPLSALGWETGEGITYKGAFESIVRHAIEIDRAQRSKMEQFGTAVYEIMDGEEWSSDTTQYIGDVAHALGITFAAPEYDE